jgi:carbon storage regulator
MLVLSRKLNEGIIVGEGDTAVEITVVSIKGKTIRLGFDAPKDMSIFRKEVFEAAKKKTEITVNLE